MAERRWLVAAGAGILGLMLVAAAFSLGVYVGEHGWTRGGLTYQPQQPGGLLPDAGAPGGPGGAPPAGEELPRRDVPRDALAAVSGARPAGDGARRQAWRITRPPARPVGPP